MFEDYDRKEIDRVLFKAMRAIYKFERSKVGEFGLTYQDIYLLQFLRREKPVTMSELADEMEIPISTATRVIDRLEKKKLLKRLRNPDDRRIITVMLTASGDTIVDDVEEHTFQILTGNVQGLSEDDINCFIKTALHMDRILNVEKSGQ